MSLVVPVVVGLVWFDRRLLGVMLPIWWAGDCHPFLVLRFPSNPLTPRPPFAPCAPTGPQTLRAMKGADQYLLFIPPLEEDSGTGEWMRLTKRLTDYELRPGATVILRYRQARAHASCVCGVACVGVSCYEGADLTGSADCEWLQPVWWESGGMNKAMAGRIFNRANLIAPFSITNQPPPCHSLLVPTIHHHQSTTPSPLFISMPPVHGTYTPPPFFLSF